jgi:hypothetical protein
MCGAIIKLMHTHFKDLSSALYRVKWPNGVQVTHCLLAWIAVALS